MQGSNRDRLVKLLGLSRSRFDAEAIGAIRKANELLADQKVTWDDVIVRSSEAPTPVSPVEHEPEDDYVPTPPNAAALFRQRIRRVPLVIRLALAPLWLSAEAAAEGVIGTPWPAKTGGIFGTLIVFCLTGALWWFLVIGLLERLHVRF